MPFAINRDGLNSYKIKAKRQKFKWKIDKISKGGILIAKLGSGFCVNTQANSYPLGFQIL
jgi:hypothetical protein